jgi:hypothetical protein
VLCTSGYLVLVVVLHKGISPISQFVDLVRDMLPRSSPTSTTRSDAPRAILNGDEKLARLNARA